MKNALWIARHPRRYWKLRRYVKQGAKKYLPLYTPPTADEAHRQMEGRLYGELMIQEAAKARKFTTLGPW